MDMPAPLRGMPPVAEVAPGAFESSPGFLTVELRKIIKSKCLLLRKVGKGGGGREGIDTYAPVSTVRWDLGRNLLKIDLKLLARP